MNCKHTWHKYLADTISWNGNKQVWVKCCKCKETEMIRIRARFYNTPINYCNEKHNI